MESAMRRLREAPSLIPPALQLVRSDPVTARVGWSAACLEARDATGEHVRVVSGWYDGDWLDEPFAYDTHGKPCALVVERDVVALPDALTERFPAAKPAIDLG